MLVFGSSFIFDIKISDTNFDRNTFKGTYVFYIFYKLTNYVLYVLVFKTDIVHFPADREFIFLLIYFHCFIVYYYTKQHPRESIKHELEFVLWS